MLIDYLCAMQKLYFFLFFLVFCLTVLTAQKPFISTPSTVLSVPLPANTFTTAKISMVNQTSGTLTLKWLKFSNTIPSTWAADLCDYNTCYSGIPNMGTMSPISGLTQGFMKLNVNPFSYTGTGTATFYVYSGSAPLLGDTLIFNFIASGVTDIENTTQLTQENIILSPNAIHIQNYQNANEIQIIDWQGKVLFQQSCMPYTHEILYTGHLPTGIYIVRTRHQMYKYFKP